MHLKGTAQPAGTSAHHIVPATRNLPSTNAARDILTKYGINVNDAQNGRSTKSFIDEGRWQAIVDRLKKSDIVFIEFGHNDENKDKPATYASPEDYKANLISFIA